MNSMSPIYKTRLGKLYQADCNDFLSGVPSESVDLVFADPPFNLGKTYASKIDDSKTAADYLTWSKSWIDRLADVLKPGGALFLWNLPKWNLLLGSFLADRLTFRHWISVDIKYSLPITGRLYPSHYSLLYFIKGKRPAIFHPDRLPVPCCRHCGGELPDYGGYKDKMNPKGVNLSDVWTDIPPVRHAKYKRRAANALSLKLLDRIVSIATEPGSTVLDPFGGSGTTYVAAELTGRRWLGCELDCSDIVARFKSLDLDKEHLAQIQSNKNTLFTSASLARRRKSGRPLSPNYKVANSDVAICACENVTGQTDLFNAS